MNHVRFLFLLTCAIAVTISMPSCKKDEPPAPAPAATPPAKLRLLHTVDDAPLKFDTMAYTNAAGNVYSVSRVEYYLSELVLTGTGSTPNDTLHGPWYFNARENHDIPIGYLRAGTYSGAKLLLGIPPALNLTGALPNTLDNINMAWPEPMGGGYHFIKFEGHFDDNGTQAGFAMHIGNDQFLPACELPGNFTITGQGGTLQIDFNLNEVFRTPHVYDLHAGNYSMGSMELMGKLRDNCMDAFALQYLP